MTRVRINELARHDGASVTVQGWVSTTRSSGKIAFVVLRDGTGALQAVFSRKDVAAETWERLGGLTQETSVAITGTVRAEARAPGGYEMHGAELVVIGASEDFPIQPKEHSTQFLFEHRHLWLRSRRQVAIARVRNEVVQAIRDFFYERDFILVDTPILTGSIGEQAGELFSTEYFDLGKAYLAQTGQLYVEAAAAALGKVYCFGPTFRAEKSKTRRHLTEFWMVEPEVAFHDSNDNMRLQEAFVSYVVGRTIERRAEELKELERDTAPLQRVQAPFARISYTDAVARLNALGSDMEWGRDLGGDDETLLAQQYDRPVFVYNYPKGVKAFYMKENPDDPRTVLNNDCLAPEGYGEIIGGSQREDSYDRLLARILEQGLDPEAYRWYLDLRKYGTFVHSGFGLGVERTVAWICGLPHIRETIAFPRQIHRLYP
ncbi:MAG: asparagine--tRNA ligase [Gemmatimonadetes bacterium]|nr:asparagine--tRNA ligase [Gemmatimonadota bacterium]MBP9199715.1 asparagine--tRNA ligase [Gemmatimonadales bacterium]MBK6778791.1 asparagine--tRNA ligase [Gemmatimonadota bacterium]MBK7348898.1 asparagine--tRNA ligase [Gemmatimonadota bacterium]MBK7714461.1 asparagine--tRNA ligase [Gemmatimonadota bacterium]